MDRPLRGGTRQPGSPTPGDRPRTASAWLVAVALCAANLPLHKPISDACDALFRLLGRPGYEYLTLLGISGISAAGAWVLGRGGGLQRGGALVPVGALAVLSIAAQQLLLVSNVELIHFPQFGLLAALLLATGLKPEPAWLLATAAGVLDEIYQHRIIYAEVPGVYMDFNDIVLNAIGAAWAVALVSLARSSATAGSVAPPVPFVGWRIWATLALLVALPFLFWMDPPSLHPFLVKALTGRSYRVLTVAESVVALLILWLIVLRATQRGPRPDCGVASRESNARRTSLGAATRNAILFFCLSTAAGCTTVPPLTVTELETRPPFLLTFWCGPPLEQFDAARAAEIAAAGFNIVGAPCEGKFSAELNRRALDVAHRHGLKMWISDHRIGQYRPRPDWEALLIEGLADYPDHPALDGYFLIDEPTADRFDDLAPVVRKLRSEDPERLAYINLLPDFIPPEILQAESYRDYVESFVTKVRPRLLSYDHYPFKKKRVDRPSYFENLQTIRDVAQRHDLPFLLIVQAMPHGPYRDPSEAELSWQVFHGLAYGASGISYFAYWTPVRVQGAERLKFRYGLIEDGKPTLHYFQVQRLNRKLASFAGQLTGMRSVQVADSLGEIAPAADFGPLRAVSGGPITIGFFAVADSETLFALLVNRDYRYAVDAELVVRDDSALPSQFDPEPGEWMALRSPIVALPPGGAALIRWADRRSDGP